MSSAKLSTAQETFTVPPSVLSTPHSAVVIDWAPPHGMGQPTAHADIAIKRPSRAQRFIEAQERVGGHACEQRARSLAAEAPRDHTGRLHGERAEARHSSAGRAE